MVERDTRLGKIVSESEERFERSPEQHEAARRRSLPVAIGGALCGLGALALLASRTIRFDTPPNVYALNLFFCAILIGIGIIFYVRGTTGTRTAIGVSMIAILSGLVGPLIFARQSVTWHEQMEGREADHVSSIAKAAYHYAVLHDGRYPADVAALLDAKLLTPDDVHSPFGNDESITQKKKLSPEAYETWYARHSDYSYLGGDLDLKRVGSPTATAPGAATAPGKGPASAKAAAFPALDQLPPDLIVAASFDVIMSTQMSASFMDGHAEFLDLEKAEAALAKTNEERQKMGLPAVKPPDAVERAREQEQTGATQK